VAVHPQALQQTPEKLPLDFVVGCLEVHNTYVQRLTSMPVFVNDMLKGEGRMDGRYPVLAVDRSCCCSVYLTRRYTMTLGYSVLVGSPAEIGL